jgi:hypothetical protein
VGFAGLLLFSVKAKFSLQSGELLAHFIDFVEQYAGGHR